MSRFENSLICSFNKMNVNYMPITAGYRKYSNKIENLHSNSATKSLHSNIGSK